MFCPEKTIILLLHLVMETVFSMSLFDQISFYPLKIITEVRKTKSAFSIINVEVIKTRKWQSKIL